MEMYRNMAKPAQAYDSETLSLKKAQETKFEVAEIRMARWICGVPKLDRTYNERKMGQGKSGEISTKVRERRLK